MAPVTNQDVRSGEESERLFEKYRFLPERGIRLIELLPRQSRLSRESLQCNIIDAQLDTQVEFEALSYCWGTLKPDKKYLTVLNYGSHKFMITDSLAEAFRRFQYKDKSRLIWADFICINQKRSKDNVEKGRQIGMMTAIYSQAMGVLAWVGPSRPDDNAAFKAEYPTDTEGKLYHAMALGHLLERDWFTRMWIIQEAATAKRLTLCCGDQILDWSSFSHFLERMLTEHGFMLNTSRTDGGLEKIMTMMSIRNLVTEHIDVPNSASKDFRVLRLNRLDQQRPKPVVQSGDFSRFASKARVFGATDQRDRIYAFRGLVPVAEKGEEPNYNKSEPEVFEDFTVHMIERGQNINLLAQAGIHENALPSWVPDFSRRSDTYALNVETYRASPVQSTNISHADGKLVATGHVIDRISHLLPGFDNFETAPANDPQRRDRPWTAGEHPPHEKLELFERTVSESMAVLSPFVGMIKGGPKGLVTEGPKFVGQLISKAASIPSAMKDRTRRITSENEQSWRELALKHGSGRYSDPMTAYRQTLQGGLPLAAIGSDLNSRFEETMYVIWQERSEQNPIVNRGFTSASGLKGVSKTGQPLIACPAELKIAYFDGVGKKNSDSDVKNHREKFKQTGGTAARPILTDRQVYAVGHGIKKLFGGKDDSKEEDEAGMTEYEKKLAYYDNADPWFKSNDDIEAKQYLARLYSREVERMAGHRQFAVTGSGYMGWVPEIAREGDEVWILDGGNVPFVMRRFGQGGEYELVGEAYVQGMMMGEWFQGKERDQLLEQRKRVELV